METVRLIGKMEEGEKAFKQVTSGGSSNRKLAHDPDAMDTTPDNGMAVNAQQAQQGGKKKGKPKEKRCYRCNQTGHFLRQCDWQFSGSSWKKQKPPSSDNNRDKGNDKGQ